MPVNEFFVNFSDTTADHDGSFHGYWGLIFDTGMSPNGTFWLNTGEYDDLSVMVPAHLYSDFRRRAKVTSDSELEGMHVLVLGKLREASTRKLIIELEDLDRLALCDD